jgi:hypothetical protein
MKFEKLNKMNYIENVPKNIKQTSVQDPHILFGHIKLINVRYHPINNQNTLSNPLPSKQLAE